jgi:hypothetical protein
MFKKIFLILIFFCATIVFAETPPVMEYSFGCSTMLDLTILSPRPRDRIRFVNHSDKSNFDVSLFVYRNNKWTVIGSSSLKDYDDMDFLNSNVNNLKDIDYIAITGRSLASITCHAEVHNHDLYIYVDNVRTREDTLNFKFTCSKPNFLGGVSVNIFFRNIKKATIKYVKITFTPYNRVHDIIIDKNGETDKTLVMVDFIAPGEDKTSFFDNVWYDDSFGYAAVKKCEIIYTDDTSETLNLSAY